MRVDASWVRRANRSYPLDRAAADAAGDDVPATGLGAGSRAGLWAMLPAAARGAGDHRLRTARCLDEAEPLADRFVVADRGGTVAEGTAEEMRALRADPGARCCRRRR